MSKITRGGQITLPKTLRHKGAFARAHSVEFVERAGAIVVQPVLPAARLLEAPILEHTMRDWLDEKHDNLFDLS